MKKEHFCLLIIFLVLISPILVFADGGMVIWPPTIELEQSAQNAIVAWDGSEEIIILSIDIESSDNATTLRIIPLPSNPSEVKEGSFESFEKLVEIINEKIEAGNWRTPDFEAGGKAMAPAAGVEITFQKKIGAHDVTVVKVNDLDYFLDWVKGFSTDKGFQQKQISSEFREGVKNYLKKDIKYFVFDVIETGKEKESLKPLIYRFDSDFLYYPLLISGISEIGESRTEVNLFLITEKGVYLEDYYNYWEFSSEITLELNAYELEQVSEDIADLFKGEVVVAKTNVYKRLRELTKDIILPPSYLWDRALTLNSSGKEVKVLQQILINEGSWKSDVGATGYFGTVTQRALVEFQEEHSFDILEPIGLEQGTGYFGSKTQDYLKGISLSFQQPVQPIEPIFSRNLSLGMRGNDVRTLQEILIEEGVWQRPDVGATGYFGSITKAAVIRYQDKYASEILAPLGLTEGTGFVGPSTRQHLEKR